MNTQTRNKFLIIVPASLIPNWVKEFRNWIPDIEYQILSGTTPDKFAINQIISPTSTIRVFLISYESFRGSLSIDEKNVKTKKVFPWATIFSTVSNLHVICDEAHYYKNPETSNAQAIFSIMNDPVIIPMTGTPMKNGPKDLHSLVKSVSPDLAGTYGGWISMHTMDSGRTARNPERLRKILSPYMFRRLKRDVIKELPPINRITLEHQLSPKAMVAYQSILAGFYQSLDKWDGDPKNAFEVNGMLAQLIRMKQTCAEDKIDFVANRALETYDADESDYNKVIIFSQFANNPPIVSSIANKLGGESLYFTGNDSSDKRFALVEQFQTDPSIHFLVASTKAAMEGLNITKAGHVIFTDFMWTPADHQQAEGRAYGRLSDLHTITSTYVVAADTIEESIVSILYKKIIQNATIVDGLDAEDESSIMMDVLIQLKSQRS